MTKPISWITLAKGTRVVGRDGGDIGTVADVVADRQKDIFSGISVSAGILSTDRFVPAELIEQMTDDEVRLTIGAAEAESSLEPYS